MPPHRGLEFWTEQIQHYEESGLPQKAFCRNTGLARSTLQHWKRKLQKQKLESCNHVVAVPAAGLPRAPRGLRLHIRGGYLLEVEPEFCQQTLREVLEVVGG